MSLLREIILKITELEKNTVNLILYIVVFKLVSLKKKYSYLSLFQKIFDETTCFIIILF